MIIMTVKEKQKISETRLFSVAKISDLSIELLKIHFCSMVARSPSRTMS